MEKLMSSFDDKNTTPKNGRKALRSARTVERDAVEREEVRAGEIETEAVEKVRAETVEAREVRAEAVEAEAVRAEAVEKVRAEAVEAREVRAEEVQKEDVRAVEAAVAEAVRLLEAAEVQKAVRVLLALVGAGPGDLESEYSERNRRVEDALFKLAESGNATAIIFWLKNRLPELWREKPESNGGQGVLPELLEAFRELREKRAG